MKGDPWSGGKQKALLRAALDHKLCLELRYSEVQSIVLY